MIQTNKKPNIVLDTNILPVSIPEKSKYRSIFENFINENFVLCITNDILKEYEEILSERYDSETVENIMEILLIADNVKKQIFIIIGILSLLILMIDNKFVDCAIASNADYLVTNDKHFDILKKIDFPKVNTIKIDKFIKFLK